MDCDQSSPLSIVTSFLLLHLLAPGVYFLVTLSAAFRRFHSLLSSVLLIISYVSRDAYDLQIKFFGAFTGALALPSTVLRFGQRAPSRGRGCRVGAGRWPSGTLVLARSLGCLLGDHAFVAFGVYISELAGYFSSASWTLEGAAGDCGEPLAWRSLLVSHSVGGRSAACRSSWHLLGLRFAGALQRCLWVLWVGGQRVLQTSF